MEVESTSLALMKNSNRINKNYLPSVVSTTKTKRKLSLPLLKISALLICSLEKPLKYFQAFWKIQMMKSLFSDVSTNSRRLLLETTMETLTFLVMTQVSYNANLRNMRER